MITITTELTGLTQLTLTLNALASIRFEAFHREAADYMKGSVEQNYRDKVAPDGTPWRGHGVEYPKWLAQRGGAPREVLDLTGAMKSSLTATANETEGRVFYRSQGYGDRWHGAGMTTGRLAWLHQVGAHTPAFPWRGIPKRPQMGFSTARGDVAHLETMLKRFVQDKVASTSLVTGRSSSNWFWGRLINRLSYGFGRSWAR
jgi:phage gpG-like protein